MLLGERTVLSDGQIDPNLSQAVELKFQLEFSMFNPNVDSSLRPAGLKATPTFHHLPNST